MSLELNGESFYLMLSCFSSFFFCPYFVKDKNFSVEYKNCILEKLKILFFSRYFPFVVSTFLSGTLRMPTKFQNSIYTFYRFVFILVSSSFHSFLSVFLIYFCTIEINRSGLGANLLCFTRDFNFDYSINPLIESQIVF